MKRRPDITLIEVIILLCGGKEPRRLFLVPTQDAKAGESSQRGCHAGLIAQLASARHALPVLIGGVIHIALGSRDIAEVAKHVGRAAIVLDLRQQRQALLEACGRAGKVVLQECHPGPVAQREHQPLGVLRVAPHRFTGIQVFRRLVKVSAGFRGAVHVIYVFCQEPEFRTHLPPAESRAKSGTRLRHPGALNAWRMPAHPCSAPADRKLILTSAQA